MVQGQPLKPTTRFRALAALPEGALPVGAGLVLSGLAAYGFLVLTARALGPDEYAALSALWAIVALVGPGLFLPVEQELSRAISARRATGDGSRPLVTRALSTGAAAVVVVLSALALGSGWVADTLFDGSLVLVVAFGGTLLTYFVMHMAKGVLSGTGRFGRYSVLLVVEGMVRLAACAALFAAGVRFAGWYAGVFAAAPLVAAGIAYAGSSRLDDGPPAPFKELSTSLGYLVAASLLAQTMVNFGPLAVKALAAPSQKAAAGQFLAGLVVTRVPLFLFAAIYTPLLPRLAALATLGRMREFRRGLNAVLVAVVGIGVLATAGSYAVGPLVVRVLFGEGFDLARVDLVYLAAGSSVYMLALAIAQALIALSGHRLVAVGWLVGVVTLVIVTALMTGLLERVEQGFLAGSIAASLAMFLLLRSAMKHGKPAGPMTASEAAMEVPVEP